MHFLHAPCGGRGTWVRRRDAHEGDTAVLERIGREVFFRNKETHLTVVELLEVAEDVVRGFAEEMRTRGIRRP